MKKVLGSLKGSSRRRSQVFSRNAPEEGIERDVRQFCDSSADPNSGDEVLHLPKIVEAAESSPNAAAGAMYQLRKSFGKDNFSTAYKQYQAMMLFRILIDNPGTCKYASKNVDSKFVEAVRLVLRMNRDPSVQQISRETLEHLSKDKKNDKDLAALLKMWEKEKGNPALGATQRYKGGSIRQGGPPPAPHQPNPAGPVHSNGRSRHALPDAAELAGRIEEAKTSAKLLIQLVQSTPPAEFNSNELIREFADRCQSAQRSLHGYMNCTDPAPDEATFQTLIETCEQLSLASSKHQRATLAARKQNQDAVGRAENLYSSNSRDPSPNSAISPPPPKPLPTSPSQLDRLAPLSRHASPRDESQPNGVQTTEEFNPFADSNRVSQLSTAPPPRPVPTQSYGTKRSPPQSQAPFVELPTASTPPPTHSAYSPPSPIDTEQATPPPGPPPSRKPIPPVPTSYPVDNNTNRGLGVMDVSHHERPESAESNDLYSADHHSHYTEPNGASARPVWGEADSPRTDELGNRSTMLSPRGKTKVKDDEPFSPVGGVSGSGWGY